MLQGAIPFSLATWRNRGLCTGFKFSCLNGVWLIWLLFLTPQESVINNLVLFISIVLVCTPARPERHSIPQQTPAARRGFPSGLHKPRHMGELCEHCWSPGDGHIPAPALPPSANRWEPHREMGSKYELHFILPSTLRGFMWSLLCLLPAHFKQPPGCWPRSDSLSVLGG